jgi:MerR family regulatory protein
VKQETGRVRASSGAWEPSTDLVSIGEFAGLSHLSPTALRLDDELGLLVAARVDTDAGYRRYAPAAQ